jgi:enolase
MSHIKQITCHKIVNSRGDWTIETQVELEDGSIGEQSIPDGASKGLHEAATIPVDKAVDIVSSVLNEAFQGVNVFDQVAIDRTMLEMDGSPNKRNMGANSMLSVSLACAQAAAVCKKLPLYQYLHELYKNQFHAEAKLGFPTPVFNVLNGGLHARNNLSFQEFMVIPSPDLSYKASLEMGVDIYHLLKDVLEKKHKGVGVGDEGGFAPNDLDPFSALELVKKATKEKYSPGHNVFFGMDVAAGSFVKKDKYFIRELDAHFNGKQVLDLYKQLLAKYELIYLEDPFYENHDEFWAQAKRELGSRVMIVGDDLVVTNKQLLKHVLEKDLINAVIVKPNQVGTLTETFEFVKLAKSNGLAIVLSHRSGDTAEDTFIADFAVAVGAQFMKSGSPARGERVAKYNRLLEIEAECDLTDFAN